MNRTKKILFLAPYPENLAASQRYRFEQYLDTLREAGFQLELAPFFRKETWEVLYKQGHWVQKIIGTLVGLTNRFLLLFKVSKFDWIFIHREALPFGPPVYEWILTKLLRKKIVFDFDDAIWIHQASRGNALISHLKSPDKTATICELSKKVVAGNYYLEGYAKKRNLNVQVIPTTIDTEYHDQTKNHTEKEVVTLGWTGTHSTLPYLQLLIRPLKQLERRYPVKLLVIADQKAELEIQSVEFRTWSIEAEVEDLLDIDIGLMPLPETEWAKGKCGLKALQYMALGIPAVVSSVGVNQEIVTHGKHGFCCGTESEWEKYLEILIQDIELRNRMGRLGRSKVEQLYSVKANKSNYLSLFYDE
jgi:glycosyltransferase involved in cell wall biosynthesis